MRPVILSPDKLDDPGSYPSWCGLGWFRNYRHLPAGTCDVHYHDLPEVYLWHEGMARAVIDKQPVAMAPGVVGYTAAGAEHSYVAKGVYSNTGLTPKPFPGCRSGHLHRRETGESPVPEVRSFVVPPESNPLDAASAVVAEPVAVPTPEALALPEPLRALCKTSPLRFCGPVHEFVRSVVQDREPELGTARSFDINAPGICAHASAMSNGTRIAVPLCPSAPVR